MGKHKISKCDIFRELQTIIASIKQEQSAKKTIRDLEK